MKRTKLLTWILTVAIIVAASMALVACVDKPQVKQLTELTLPQLDDDQMAVIIKNGEKDYTSYTVTLTDQLKTGEDVLNYLAEKADLHVDWKESAYGKYINEIGGAKLHETNEYVAVFTSVAGDKSTEAGALSYQIGDITVVYAGKGISELSVEAGAVIYFEIVTY